MSAQMSTIQRPEVSQHQAPPQTAVQPGRLLHPLIAYIAHRLEILSELVEFENDGVPVEFDGFRLRDLSQWTLSHDKTLLGNFGSLSGYCNVRCNFCYEVGNPLPYDLTMLSVEEAQTRARHYQPELRRGLLQFSERLDLEVFTNPSLIEILTIFREQDPDHFISLTTNGARLDDRMLAQLADLRPLHLIISLNNSDPMARKEIMHDPRSQVAVEAIRKLRSFGIPYTGGIVAWPDLPEAELRRTIRFFDDHAARTIRVSLPSYSGYFSDGETLFDTEKEWERIFSIVEEEAEIIGTPISAVPYLFRGVPIVPRVSGVIRNSPAFFGGLRRDDIIVSVQGNPVFSRMECKQLINEQIIAGKGVIGLEIERGGQRLSFTLDDRSDQNADLYPYKPSGYKSPYEQGDSFQSLMGLFLNDDIDPSDVWSVVDLARKHKAETVVILTSQLVEPVLCEYLKKNPALVEATRDLNIVVISPQHKFWGGNIMVGDLYLCEDYIACLKRVTSRLGKKPDLAVIPSTFSPNNWTDLAGVPYSEITVQTGVPVELVPCKQIIV
jgi:sulfatase maturation enzyme AslB (radical SAM superfamily)